MGVYIGFWEDRGTGVGNGIWVGRKGEGHGKEEWGRVEVSGDYSGYWVQGIEDYE